MKLKEIILALVIISYPVSINAEKNCGSDIPNPPLDGQIKIAEIKPTDTGDDNGWVRLKNVSGECMDLAGWILYDGNLEHELFITPENTEGFSDGLLLAPGMEAKVFQKGDKDFTLGSSGGRAELYSGPAEMLGAIQDSASYPKIDKGEVYRVIATENMGTEPVDQTSFQEHIYQIPEETNHESRITNQVDRDNKSLKKEKSEKEEGDSSPRTLSSPKDPVDTARGSTLNNKVQGEGINKEINSNINIGDNPIPLIASASKEKSPWRWFYWLWGNWFLRRIILPFLVLWAFLYMTVYYVRKRYLR